MIINAYKYLKQLYNEIFELFHWSVGTIWDMIKVHMCGIWYDWLLPSENEWATSWLKTSVVSKATGTKWCETNSSLYIETSLRCCSFFSHGSCFGWTDSYVWCSKRGMVGCIPHESLPSGPRSDGDFIRSSTIPPKKTCRFQLYWDLDGCEGLVNHIIEGWVSRQMALTLSATQSMHTRGSTIWPQWWHVCSTQRAESKQRSNATLITSLSSLRPCNWWYRGSSESKPQIPFANG
jgi:hypothetical protein